MPRASLHWERHRFGWWSYQNVKEIQFDLKFYKVLPDKFSYIYIIIFLHCTARDLGLLWKFWGIKPMTLYIQTQSDCSYTKLHLWTCTGTWYNRVFFQHPQDKSKPYMFTGSVQYLKYWPIIPTFLYANARFSRVLSRSFCWSLSSFSSCNRHCCMWWIAWKGQKCSFNPSVMLQELEKNL